MKQKPRLKRFINRIKVSFFMDDETNIRKVLEILATGVTCDYQLVRGGVVMILDERAQKSEGVDISTFLALRKEGYIDMDPKDTLNSWHPVFRPSFQNPVNLYNITSKGKEYLERRQ